MQATVTEITEQLVELRKENEHLRRRNRRLEDYRTQLCETVALANRKLRKLTTENFELKAELEEARRDG